MKGKRSAVWFGAVLICVLSLGVSSIGCRQESAADRVSKLRAGYTATLNGFVVQQEPMQAAAEGEAGEGADAAPEEAAAPSVRQNVMLDILVRNDNDERLPGLTLDVSQADPNGAEKASWKVWVDSSAIGPGPGVQVSHVLKDVDYQEGDGFNVEVRTPIPSSERGEYHEFPSSDGQ